MSDFVIGASPHQANETAISLNMGLATTGGLASFLVPEGTHKFLITQIPEVNFTKNGEAMIVMDCQVVESNVGEALGVSQTERMIIPGDDRKENEPQKWQTMMKMLRLKLEAITGKTWREDNLNLRPKDLANCMFIATVSHEKTYGEPGEDGTKREFTNARLNNWQTVHNTAQQTMPGVIGKVDPTANIEPF